MYGVRCSLTLETRMKMSKSHRLSMTEFRYTFQNKLKFSGENASNVKLTWILVNKIRKEYAMGDISHQKLAMKYNVSDSTIDNIVNYRSWKNGV